MCRGSLIIPRAAGLIRNCVPEMGLGPAYDRGCRNDRCRVDPVRMCQLYCKQGRAAHRKLCRQRPQREAGPRDDRPQTLRILAEHHEHRSRLCLPIVDDEKRLFELLQLLR